MPGWCSKELSSEPWLSRPETLDVSNVGGSSPSRIRNRVDLPTPLAPTIAYLKLRVRKTEVIEG